MSLETKTYLRPEEYLEWERKADVRHQYVQGEMAPMAGASPNHVLIVTNIVSEIRMQLKNQPCTVYSTDLRVAAAQTALFTYPDVVVVSGNPSFYDEKNDTITNPVLIIEVLSETTKDYGRGEKFEHYRTIESFREYIFVAQDKCHVEHYTRQPDNRWLLAETNLPSDTIQLKSVKCQLALQEVYGKVNLLETK